MELVDKEDIQIKKKLFGRRRYDRNINDNYSDYINRFLNIIDKDVDDVTINDINMYLEIRKKELKYYTFQQLRRALNFLAKEINPPKLYPDTDISMTESPVIHEIKESDISKGIKIRGLSLTTGYMYYRKLVELNDFLNNKSEYDITIQDLQDFINHKINQGRSGGTIHNYRSAFMFYFREKKIKLDFSQLIIPKRNRKKLPITLTKSEIQRLINCSDQVLKLIIKLCYGSGLRVSELLNVKPKDFNFEEKTLKVSWEGSKGKKERFTFVSESFLKDYLNYFNNFPMERPLFRYTDAALNRKLKETAMIAGINKDIHMHTLRHSFATHYYAETKDLVSLSRLLGHENISATMIYIHLGGEYVKIGKSPLDT